MPVPLSFDERRLAFEARRLAVETLIKVYLEHVTHARHLVTAHLRLMFTLSLGALAGVVTLYGATLRVGIANGIGTLDRLEVATGLVSLASLVASALLSATALRRTAIIAVSFVRDPFPKVASEIASIFELGSLDENDVLRKLHHTIDKGLEGPPMFEVEVRWSTSLLVFGLLAAGLSFLI